MAKIAQHLLSRQSFPVFFGFGALAAFGLGLLAPVSAGFDLFAQFSFHWLVLAVLAALACFAKRFAYSIVALGIGVAVLLPVVMTQLYAAPPVLGELDAGSGLEVKRHPHQLKLVSFNTYNPSNNVEAIWQEITRHDADVVVLIEFGPNKRTLMPRLIKAYPYHRSCAKDWDCALGLFSRLPADNFRIVRPRDDAGPSLIAADVQFGHSTVRVVGTHVISPNHGPRANFIELDHLAKRLGEHGGTMILAGDLNTTLWANGFDNFRRKSGLVHMGGLVPTWPARPLPLPQIGIDHVFTSSDLKVSEVRTGRAAGSDHLPLIVSIEKRAAGSRLSSNDQPAAK